MKDKFEVNIDIVNKEFTEFISEKIRINTELKDNVFILKTTIPKYIFDFIKDSDPVKYNTSRPGKWNPNKTPHKQFKQVLKSDTLSSLIGLLETISRDCLSLQDFNHAQYDKMIAIKFNHSIHKDRDNFNFSYMGKKFNMNFQFFVVYSYQQKSLMGENITHYKTRESIYDVTKKEAFFTNNKNRDWYMFNHDISKEFNLIKWSQDAENFLTDIQNKFVSISENLDKYLKDIDDVKMFELINMNQKLLF